MRAKADSAWLTRGSVRRLSLAAIVIAFVMLSGAYGVINPIFEAPDELWHFLNVKFIRDNRALIVQTNNGLENPARQEGGQPPLYYLLSAAVISWLPSESAEEVAILNYHGQPGNVDSKINKNVVIHSEDEAFPYQGISLAVHLLRGFSILLSAGTIITTFLIAKEVFPESTTIPSAAAAFNAFVPQFVFISASINNDNLVTLISALTLLLLLKIVKGDVKNQTFLALGALVGLASITKISGLGLVPLSLIVTFGLAAHRRSIGIAVRAVVSVFGGLILLGGWWYVRNWLLYADPLGLNVFLNSVNRADVKAPMDIVLTNYATLMISFWALFGWSNIQADAYVYWFFNVVLLVGSLGIVLGGMVKYRTRDNRLSPLLLIPSIWLSMLLVALAVWTSRVGYDVGRLLFPSISGVSLLIVLGITRIFGRRLSTPILSLLMVAMLAVAAAMPVLYIRPAYKHGVQFVQSQRSLAKPLNATFEDKIRLLGYELSRDATTPGQSVNVMLYWEPLPGLDEGLYNIGLDLVTEDRTRSLSPVSDGLTEANIVRRLRKTGWLLKNAYELRVPADAEVFTHLPLVVRVERQSAGFLEAYDGLMRPIGHDVVVARIRVDDTN